MGGTDDADTPDRAPGPVRRPNDDPTPADEAGTGNPTGPARAANGDPSASVSTGIRGPGVVSWFDTAAQYAWRGLVVLVAAAAAVWALAFLYLVTIPVILALVLSTFCVPLARRLQDRGIPSAGAAAIVVLGGLAVLVGVVAATAPSFARQINELGPTVEEGIDDFFEWLEEGPVDYTREDLSESITAYLSGDGVATSLATRVAIAVVELFTAVALAIVLLFFFVKDGPAIVAWLVARMPGGQRDAVRAVGARSWRALGGFMGGTAQVALIDAVGIGLGLVIIGVPLALPLATLIFLGGFVPVVGATVTGFLAVAVALAWGGIGPALLVLALVLAVQQIESNVLQPVIMRNAVSLHPVVVLGGITAGAVIGGIIGAFLAIPVTAMAAAAGNELRLRHEAREAGLPLGPTPIGGAWAVQAEPAKPVESAVAAEPAEPVESAVAAEPAEAADSGPEPTRDDTDPSAS